MAGQELGTIRGKIEIEYDDKGTAKADSSIKGLEGSAQKTTGTIGSLFQGMVVGIGIAIAQMAIDFVKQMGGMVVDSIKSFGSFQQGMNEVFTLLPGISGDAMDKMTKQTLATAKEMKVLPEDVVPSLYSALSAGVPPDNVFDFLITANKLAKGGVTDLDTAVTTISATVNAYGSDVISAEEVSDQLFTAVKGGITTVDQLGSSLYNVIPTAASAGVEFGNVTAALATMTSQGTPTAQSTTQLRQLLVELTKDGGKAAKTFEDMAGKSFRDFTAEGGNVQEALQLMEKAAKENDVTISDLFGSVEAGNAALALTGAGTQKFTDELANAADSAGATDEAFEQMSTGIVDAWAEVKVSIDAFVKGVMLKAAPLIEDGINKIGQAFDFLQNSAIPALKEVAQWVQRNEKPIKIVAAIIAAIFIPHWIALGIAATVNAAKTVAAWVATQIAAIRAAVVHSAQIVFMVARWGFLAARAAVSAARVAAAWVVTQVGAAGAAAASVGAFAVMLAAWARAGVQALIHAAKIALAWIISMGPIAIVIAIIIALVALIIANFDKIKAFIMKVFKAVWDFLKGVWENIVNFFKAALKIFVDLFKKYHPLGIIISNWDKIVAFLKGIWNTIVDFFKAGLNLWLSIFRNVLNFIINLWKNIWNNAKSIITSVINAIRNVIQSGIDRVKSIINGLSVIVGRVKDFFNRARQAAVDRLNSLISFVKGLPKKIISALGNLGNRLYSAGKDLILGLINGIKDMAGRAAQAAKDAVKGAIDGAKNLLGISSPSKVFMKEVGEPIMQGVAVGVDRKKNLPQQSVDNALSLLTTNASPTVNAVLSGGQAGNNYTFGPGSITLDLSKMKSIDDVVRAVESLRSTSRQFVRK